jgi:hypothetical protein
MNCIFKTPCFSCLVRERIDQIAAEVSRENRAPTDMELDEVMTLQDSMVADIMERSHKRQNIIESMRLGIL